MPTVEFLDTIMGKSWDLSVKGKDHKIVVDGSEPGKDVIRIDGRVAARALDADETQRAFVVQGSYFSLRRSGSNDFELTPIGTGVDRAPIATAAAPASRHAFNNVIFWTAVAVVAAALLGWAMW